MRHTLHSEQWLPWSPPAVFAFFATPLNLPPLMPPWQGARIEEAILQPPPPSPSESPRNIVAAGAGTRLILSFRAFPRSPLRLNWHARIAEFEWNHHFCDVQDRGPFKHWRHCHHIEPQTKDGVEGTLLTDDLEYELPLGPLGDLANKLAVRKQLESIFAFRHQQTLKLLPRFVQHLRF